MAICLLYVSTGTCHLKQKKTAASNQCCDTLPGCPRCDPHQDAWKQLPRLTMDDADDASETEANVENLKTQTRGSNSALSTTNTYRVQMWRRISHAHVISCNRMFPASPVAGFNSASIVPVSTGSISVSTSNPPGIQKIILFSNKKSLHELFTTKLFNSSVLSLFFIFPITVCSDLFSILNFPSKGIVHLAVLDLLLRLWSPHSTSTRNHWAVWRHRAPH